MTRTTSRSFLDKSKAQSSETPRPDKTVCGFLFNRLPAAFNHPPTRDNKRFCDLQRRTVYVSTPSLLALGACALWVNKRFTDAFTSNKESACFYWTPPVNVLPISSYCSAFYNALTYSHCPGKCFTEVVKWMHCPWVQGVCRALEWKPQVAK